MDNFLIKKTKGRATFKVEKRAEAYKYFTVLCRPRHDTFCYKAEAWL